MALIISAEETRELLDMRGAMRALDKMFQDRAAGKMRSVPRRRLKGSSKQLNMMAAWHQSSDLIALRAYAGGRANTITLYSGRTGAIQCIMSGAYLSSLRTGAATGVAAKYLAPARPKILGLIGPGWQGTFQVEAVVQAAKPQEILVFGRNPARRRSFIAAMRKVVPTPFREARSVAEVEEQSDILVISTNSSTPIAEGGRLKDEVLVATIGANQPSKHEVSLDLIQRVDLVVTDDLATAQNDSGDLIAASEKRLLGWEDVLPLERIAAGGRPEPRPAKILFQSNGIPDEDLAVGTVVLRRALKRKAVFRELSEF